MKAKLLKFCRDLRRASISTVSVAETIEAMKALSHIRITDMEEFKITLRSLLIKNSDDFQIFDTLFSIYFLNQKDKEVDEQEEEEKLKKLQEELQKNEEEFLKEFEELDNLSEEITEQHSDSDDHFKNHFKTHRSNNQALRAQAHSNRKVEIQKVEIQNNQVLRANHYQISTSLGLRKPR